MSDAKTIMDMIRENDITYVDLRFTDPRGKMQHVTAAPVTVPLQLIATSTMVTLATTGKPMGILDMSGVLHVSSPSCLNLPHTRTQCVSSRTCTRCVVTTLSDSSSCAPCRYRVNTL